MSWIHAGVWAAWFRNARPHAQRMKEEQGKKTQEDLRGCSHLTGWSCWLKCSSCQKKKVMGGRGSASPGYPVSAERAPRPSGCCQSNQVGINHKIQHYMYWTNAYINMILNLSASTGIHKTKTCPIPRLLSLIYTFDPHTKIVLLFPDVHFFPHPVIMCIRTVVYWRFQYLCCYW